MIQTDEENCVIVVPCLHPGSIRYNYFRGAGSFADVFTLTMVVAWTATYYGMRLSEEAVQRKSSKMKLLEAIVTKTNNKLGSGSTFRDMFMKAQNDFRTWARRINTTGTLGGGKSDGGGRGSVQPNIRDSDRSWGSTIERQPFDKLKV